MRNVESPRAELATTPEGNVEVEHARTPAAARAAAEVSLDALEALEHLGGLKPAFDEGDGIGEIAARRTVRGVEDNRRRVEKPELLVEAGDCGFDDLWRPPMTSVRAIRPDRDRVEVMSQTKPFALSLSMGLPFGCSARRKISASTSSARTVSVSRGCFNPPIVANPSGRSPAELSTMSAAGGLA
jgi:hypothetical protein